MTITAKGNYGFTTVVEHFSITPKPITVTADDRSSRVGQPLAELTYRYAPALCGQDAFTGALTTAANKDAAGTYEIAQGTLALSGNYALTFVKGTYTVLPKLAQDGFRFAETSVTKTYGDGTFTVTASGEASGSTVTYASDNGAVATVDGSGRVTIHAAGTAAITATASATADHAEKQVSCTLTVNRKTLTASDLAFTAGSSFTKTYDGTKACTTATVQVRDSARVNAGDALPAVTGVYAYNSANVKDAASVTFTSARTENANYILPAGLTVTHAASITPAEQAALTLTSTAAVYGTDLTLTVSGGTGDGEVTYAVTNGTGAATVSGSTLHPTQAGTVTVTATKSGGDNYRDVSTTAAVTIAKAAGGTLAAYQLQQKYSYLTTQTCAPDYAALPAGQTWTFRISDVTTSGAAAVDPAVTAIDVDTGAMTYRLTAGAEGDTVKWTVTVSSVNYEDFTREVILTLTGRDAQAALRVTGGTTVVYGQTLQLSAVGGSGTGAVTYRVDAARSTGEASIDAVTGLLTPVRVGTVTVIAVRAGDIDYNEVTSAPFELTITKATPTGEPKHTEITTGGRTLKDAALTLDGSTISLADGTLEWIDDAGNVLPDTTIVKANRTYRWRFTPADSNYTSLTGEIELYHKSTSGSTLIGTYYTIKATAGENGSISPAGRTSVREGGDQTFTITPDKGYAVAKVLVDGESVGAVKSYTFRNVTCDHTIKVIFMEANGNPQTGVSADVPVRQPAARGVVSAVSSDRVVSAIPSRPVETAVSLRRKDDAE